MHRPARALLAKARPPALDLAHLSRQTGGDLRLQRELLELFKLRSPELVAQMRALANERLERPSHLNDLAHKLKGSALAIGAFRLAAAAEAAEKAFAKSYSSGRRERGEAALNGLTAALAQSLAAIDAYMASPEACPSA